MTRAVVLMVLLALAACSGPLLPTPNSAIAVYDARENAIHVTISGLQPASEAVLIGQDGSQVSVAATTLLTGVTD